MYLEIVRGVKAKTIMLPEFQRDFRWELDQTYDLFDSLMKDIFIGTIIYGKPAFGMTLREIDHRPRKGKNSTLPVKTEYYSTDEMKQASQTRNLRIVLDGQQRLTSIYRALVGIDAVYMILKSDLDSFPINQVELENVVENVVGEESISAISVKLSDAFEAECEGLDDDELNSRFERTFFGRTLLSEADDPKRKTAAKIYRRVIRKLIDLYKQQKLVAFYLLDMSLDKFCLFFERSNSRGIQLNFTDILAAKLYHGFNLRMKIEDFDSQSKYKLNREIIVRAIAYMVGVARNGSIAIDKKFILEHLDAGDFQKHWDVACRLYADSLDYLGNQHFILSQDWMPSENMVIPLMVFLNQVKGFDRISEKQRKFIEFWYWSSVFANRYSTASNEVIITDCSALLQIAHGERISSRSFFIRIRPLISEPDDLFSYSKRSSAIYRGVLNLLGYDAHGLRNWNNTQKLDVTMRLEDHHIYPRAYISSKVKMEDIDQNEAEQLVDCVVNRTLIPKLLNIQVGKKAPSDYLRDLKQTTNFLLEECLPSHLLPLDIISDHTWNTFFKLFLEDRAQRIFHLIEKYTVDEAPEMVAQYGSSSDSGEVSRAASKRRLRDMIASNQVRIGDRVFTRKNPDKFATIIDGDTVEFEGKHVPINTWGQNMTGWSSISIYDNVLLERTGQPLKSLREEE